MKGWRDFMPLFELAPPTLAEVERAIQNMEERYFATQVFLSDAARACDVAEDDAHEWRYLLMQKRALKPRHARYLTASARKEYSREDELQAQIEVAA
jgi:hypothetical protein